MSAFFREPKRARRVFSFKCSRGTLKLPVKEIRGPKNVYSCTISMVCFPMCRCVEFQELFQSEFFNRSKIRHLQWNLATFFNVAIDRPFHGFLNFFYGQVREHPSTSLNEKEQLKISKIARFESDASLVGEDIAPQSCENLQTFVWWGQICAPPPYQRL